MCMRKLLTLIFLFIGLTCHSQTTSENIKTQLQSLIGDEVTWDIDDNKKIIEIRTQYKSEYYCYDDIDIELHGGNILEKEAQFIVSETYKKYTKVNKNQNYKNVCVSVKESIFIEYDFEEWCVYTILNIYINLQ
jgi:hypothetical protein